MQFIRKIRYLDIEKALEVIGVEGIQDDMHLFLMEKMFNYWITNNISYKLQIRLL
jgi:hypothetical protein